MRATGRSNWDRYLEVLIRAGVPERQRPWYARHLKAFVAAVGGCGLRSVSRA